MARKPRLKPKSKPKSKPLLTVQQASEIRLKHYHHDTTAEEFAKEYGVPLFYVSGILNNVILKDKGLGTSFKNQINGDS